jgi:hypothetical protein
MRQQTFRRRVVDDFSRVFHSYSSGIPSATRQAVAKALLQGTSEEVTAASVILLENIFHRFFSDLSPDVKARFQFLFVAEKDSSSAGLKRGARAPLGVLVEQLVEKGFLTWQDKRAIITGSRARMVIAGFESAFAQVVRRAADVDLTAILLAGAAEGDQSQLYVALDDGARGGRTVVVSCDRDVISAARFFFADTQLAMARIHCGAVIEISHDESVNTQRYKGAA